MRLTVERMDVATAFEFRISVGTKKVHDNSIVRIEHEDITGIGEASPSHYYGESRPLVEAALATWAPLLGEDPFALEAIEARMAQARVLAEWPQLVGERVAAVAVAESVRDDGMLMVHVKTAAWAQELSLMTPQIIARVNAGRGAGRITGSHWRVGR